MAVSDTTTVRYTDLAWHLVVTGLQDGDEACIVADTSSLYAFSAATPAASVVGIPRVGGAEFNAVLDTGDKVWLRSTDTGVDVTLTVKRNV